MLRGIPNLKTSRRSRKNIQDSKTLQSNREIVPTPQIIAFTVECAENVHRLPSPLQKISQNS